jgi:hypothetical protein
LLPLPGHFSGLQADRQHLIAAHPAPAACVPICPKETRMMETVGAAQGIAHLRLYGTAFVKALFVLPVTLLAVLLALPMVALCFTDRRSFVLNLMEELTSMIKAVMGSSDRR